MDYLHEEKTYSNQTKTERTNLLKNICQKLFRPSIYCLNSFYELKNDVLKQ